MAESNGHILQRNISVSGINGKPDAAQRLCYLGHNTAGNCRHQQNNEPYDVVRD
jgi:hypothetical protein